ncbi:CTR1-like protein kinase [Solanum lycopersicum]|uniref:non-specific serine/threonine protein kinase n=2 Tax=Solanaceae TaxID=4070 RepID=Q5YKK5_SOLLC|nr:CTR1-like protein kinase [Solanum lycopersicum]AAR89820.1 CTR1-like protein kinase [Solanum lycopersicum]AAR89823.1 CTR1-like protein kinase [Solanum lycopersicum]
MEMSTRRSNYTLLSQVADDNYLPPPPKYSVTGGGGGGGGVAPYYESHSGEKGKGKTGDNRGFDWDLSDHRSNMMQASNRIGAAAFPGSIGLQRQSSGSSFGESSISGEYYMPSLSNAEASFGYLNDGGGGAEVRMKPLEANLFGGSSSKSWAQQTEESYQLQLALALRLSSEATCADDPNFLDHVPDESASRASASAASAETLSHRFWVNGCLSYFDKVPDGFYLIHGMDPYVWIVCSDLQENARVPSIESMRAVDPSVVPSVEVILIDRRTDPSLKELQNRIHSLSPTCGTTKEVVDQLAQLVCSHMGGATSAGEDELVPLWKECSYELKDCLGSTVLPIGSLSVGLCRHRALLFKVLADAIGLPCRIAKGCKYCNRADASSCLVRFGPDREYLVDLIGSPGCLCEPDSSLNGPSSISISSPLRFPRFREVEPTTDFRSLAKQYFSDCQSLNLVFEESSAGAAVDGDAGQTDRNNIERNSAVTGPSNRDEVSRLPVPAIRDMAPVKYVRPVLHGDTQLSDPRDIGNDMRFLERGSQLVPSKISRDIALEIEDFDIPWEDLVLKERIGAGSFGTVHRADWNGSDVAVKILMEQDFHAERFKEFLREVAIMKRLRHPNIVLFMGAVTQRPNLSIVTEYLSRGSLYRLLHKPGAREVLDERRRLSMAYDVAKGMNYLHKRNPPIVHRDLKSPNLLVDKKYTVKVCDFGLSRLKANTFLSSKSAAGTPEWMAPEVLRDEPSNEKSDVYSFGVILWELATLQQPWSNLNPAQVVAAVGFKGKRLDIPRDLTPQVASIIEACWAKEPWKRPSFAAIMDMLRPLIKPPVTPPQPGRTDTQLIA